MIEAAVMPPLALDHCACIVQDLAAGAARWERHENGACDLVAVTFAADDPSMLIPRMQALGAELPLEDAGGFTAKLPRHGAVRAMRSDAWADTYGYKVTSGMHAMTVTFANLGGALDLMHERGISTNPSRLGFWIGPDDANGFVMHLVQDNARS